MTIGIGGKMRMGFTTFIRYITLVIVLAFWLVVGFTFWIPLLTRATALFCVGILRGMLSPYTRAYIDRLRAPLDFAMTFYSEGFQRIFQTLGSSAVFASDDNRNEAITELLGADHHWGKFFAELIWTLIFWVSVLLGPRILSYASHELPAVISYLTHQPTDSSSVLKSTKPTPK